MSLVGPVADQRQYHADGELATVRGASAANAAVVVSSRSSVPIAELVAQVKTPLWCSIYADGDARSRAQQAVAAGCKVKRHRLDTPPEAHTRGGARH